MVRSMKVAVIGAGTAGLSTAMELQREGHKVIVFERNDKLGGTWAYNPRVESDPLGRDPDREIISSSMYFSLRTNLPRHIMGFLDYPFVKTGGTNRDPRTFPGHEEVLSFLEDFAREFGLVGLIRFGKEVVRVERVGGESDGWVVEWKGRVKEMDPDSGMQIFEAVVVCNGKHTEPKIAEFPGMDTWPGVQIHSHNYRTEEPFRDLNVIVIGKGPSANDISKEISTIAKEVHQVYRTPTVKFGKSEKQNNTWLHPMIECAYEDGKIEFKDGSFVYADAIIHCTGYKYHIPFLKTTEILSVENNRVGPLYKHVFSTKFSPSLSFVGLVNKAIPTVMIELQAKWIAKVLSGRITLPTEEEMVSSVEQLYHHMEKTGWPVYHTHKLQQDKFEYENWIASQLGIPSTKKWIEKMFSSIHDITLSYGENFRDNWDVDKWIQEAEAEAESSN